jgi:hypothetical protein
VVANGFQETRTPAKNVVPAIDTRTSQAYMCNVRWKNKLSFLSLILAVNNNVYKQIHKH